MQIILTFKVNHPIAFPYNYNYQVQSAILQKLKEVGASDFFHNTGFSGGEGKIFKGFVFGKLLGEHSHINGQMVFTDTVSLEVRSPVFEFCDTLQRSFELNPKIRLFDSELKIYGANLNNYHINSDSVVCFTDSPVVVRIKSQCIAPDNENFVPALKKNFYDKYRIMRNAPAGEIEITPLGNHKKIVTKYKGVVLEIYSGMYRIEGNSDSLEFLYNTGLGEKNSQGFGMLNVL